MNDFFNWGLYQNISTAKQIDHFRDPSIETYKNTYYTNLLMQQQLKENREAEIKSNIQFAATIVVSIFMLLLMVFKG